MTIGCNLANTVTNTDGAFFLKGVPAGKYLATATTFDPATGWHLYGETELDIPAFGVGNCTIDLKDPDPRFRQIQVYVNHVATLEESYNGDDPGDHNNQWLKGTQVGPFDGRKNWTGQGTNQASDTQTITGQWGIGSDPNPSTIGKLTLTFTWTGWKPAGNPPVLQPSNRVRCDVLMEIRSGTNFKDVELSSYATTYIPEDATRTFDRTIVTGEAQGDHFGVSLRINNTRVP